MWKSKSSRTFVVSGDVTLIVPPWRQEKVEEVLLSTVPFISISTGQHPVQVILNPCINLEYFIDIHVREIEPRC